MKAFCWDFRCPSNSSSVPTNAGCLSGPVKSKSWPDWVCFCVRPGQDSLISNPGFDFIYFPNPPDPWRVAPKITRGTWNGRGGSCHRGLLKNRRFIVTGNRWDWIGLDWTGLLGKSNTRVAVMPSRCWRFHGPANAILGSLLSSLTVIIEPLPNEQCAL